jgi:tetratricopeptide (TPR) repeat protein
MIAPTAWRCEGRQSDAFLLAAQGRFDEAVNVVEQSLLRDPASSLVVADTGHIYYLARRYDDAVHLLRRAEELDPTSRYPRSFEARSLRFAGRPAEALDVWLWKPKSSGQDEDFRQRYATGGWPAVWRSYIERVASGKCVECSVYDTLEGLVSLRRNGDALDRLERLEKANSPVMLQLEDPMFDALRPEPRFKALLKRIRYPPES